MKTSKQDKRERIFEPIRSNWEKFKAKLDVRPSRSASIMAVILVVAFSFSVVQFFILKNKPKPEVSPNQQLIESVRNNARIDSFSFSERVADYLLLLEIQKELEEMQRDTSNIDSARVEQILKILKME